MSVHHEKTTLAARYKWKGIFEHLGMDPKALSGKHGPCPMCGGTDRFRFDNKEGSGSWICGQCGAGRGMELVMRYTGDAFPQAASRVDAILGNVRPDANLQKEQGATDDDHRRACVTLWRQTKKAEPGDLLCRYLASRGLKDIEVPENLRLHPGTRDGEGKIRPAMVARVTCPDGTGATLHRTFLREDGSAKAEMEAPRKLMPGTVCPGAAIRLGPSNRILGIAEGIETALAASSMFELSVWAAVNATMLEKWEPPSTTEELYIFADNDTNFCGQSSAFKMASRIRRTWPEIEVTVRVPDERGTDWNDVLLSHPRSYA